MKRTTLTTLITSGLVVTAVAFSAAGGALAQSNGNGGKGGGIGTSGGPGGGGSERLIVCTGCADPNAFIEDGVLKGGGHGYGGGAAAAAPVVTHVPRNPNRRRKAETVRANEACYMRQDLLADGRMLVYRDCGEVVRTYR
ncbi:hypothetical protein AB7M35_000484 [Amorphus suaedae]